MSEQLSKQENLQFVIFSLFHNNKKEKYGIEINQVKEIRELENITPVPNSPKFLKGIMNLRGRIIPVIDIKEKLGLTSEQKNNNCLVLIGEFKEKFAGFLVDEVDKVMRASKKDIEHDKTEFIKSPYVKGIAKISENIITILDLEKLLEESDLTNIQEKTIRGE